MRGLLIVNDAAPPMAPGWHPDLDQFDVAEAAPGASTLREWHQMAPANWRTDCHIRPSAATLPGLSSSRFDVEDGIGDLKYGL